MYQDVASKWWYPPTIKSLIMQPRNYNIATGDGVQAHLTPYQPQCRRTEDEHSDSVNHKQFDNI